jgi:hypothetical protein
MAAIHKSDAVEIADVAESHSSILRQYHPRAGKAVVQRPLVAGICNQKDAIGKTPAKRGNKNKADYDRHC